MSEHQPLPVGKRPCARCPAAPTTPPGEFTAQRFEDMRACTGDVNAYGPAAMINYFACHASRPGQEYACPGVLMIVGPHHIGARVRTASGELDPMFVQGEPPPDWPPLFDSYDEMAAVQGYDLDHEEEERVTSPPNATASDSMHTSVMTVNTLRDALQNAEIILSPLPGMDTAKARDDLRTTMATFTAMMRSLNGPVGDLLAWTMAVDHTLATISRATLWDNVTVEDRLSREDDRVHREVLGHVRDLTPSERGTLVEILKAAGSDLLGPPVYPDDTASPQGLLDGTEDLGLELNEMPGLDNSGSQAPVVFVDEEFQSWLRYVQSRFGRRFTARLRAEAQQLRMSR